MKQPGTDSMPQGRNGCVADSLCLLEIRRIANGSPP
jgi:hypothetical protein